MDALSALSARLATPAPSPAAAASGSALNVSQLSQWLNSKLAPGGAPAGAAASSGNAANALSALLAKVQGQGAPVAAAAPPPSASSFADLQAQEASLQMHLRQWDDQYRVLWPQHHEARQAIAAFEALGPAERAARAGDLAAWAAKAESLAQQLRNVQANQNAIKQRIAETTNQMQQHGQQQQQQQLQQQPQAGAPRVAPGYVSLAPHSLEPLPLYCYFPALLRCVRNSIVRV